MTYRLFNEYDKEKYLTEKDFSIILNLKQNTVTIM